MTNILLVEMQEERSQRNLVVLVHVEESKNHIDRQLQVISDYSSGLYLKRPPAAIILPISSGNGFIE